MREQKYADVLKKYEEELEKIELEKKKKALLEEEKMEKLSMTRELKFKDLQEHIDKTEKKEEPLNEVNASNVSKKKPGKKVEEMVKRDSGLKDKDEKDEDDEVESVIQTNNNTDDDIYLTTSFKPFKKRFKLSKVFVWLFVFFIVCGALFAFTYYVAMPIYKKYINSNPKIVFDKTIDYVGREIINFIDSSETEKDIYYSDINFKVKSNIEGFNSLGDYTYGYRMGIDPKENLMDSFVYIKNEDNEYGFSIIQKDNHYYYNYSTSDKFLDFESENKEETGDSAHEILDDVGTYDKEDLKYLIEKQMSFGKELIESDMLSSEKDELDVNGETLKVVKNSFVLDRKSYDKLAKKYVEKIKADDKYIQIVAKLSDMTIREYEDYLDEELEEPTALSGEKMDEDYKFIFNIYTVDGNKFVGFDLEENGFRLIYYYNNDGNFDFHINLSDNEECKDGGDCVLSNSSVIDVTGEKKDNSTEVQIKYNDKQAATLDIRSLTKEKMDLDYIVFVDEEKIKGDLLVIAADDSYNIDCSAKLDDEYININLFVGLKPNGNIGVIDEDNTIKYTNKDHLKEERDFIKKLTELEMFDSFNSWYSSLIEFGLF